MENSYEIIMNLDFSVYQSILALRHSKVKYQSVVNSLPKNHTVTLEKIPRLDSSMMVLFLSEFKYKDKPTKIPFKCQVGKKRYIRLNLTFGSIDSQIKLQLIQNQTKRLS